MASLAVPNPLNRLLWAIDTFDLPVSSLASASDFLTKLARSCRPIVTPVHILIPNQMGLDMESAFPLDDTIILKRRSEALRALERISRECGYPRMDPPKVLLGKAFTTSGSARSLSRFGCDMGADAIIVQSHGRGGLRRFFTGSFAEHLVQEPACPVLVVGPDYQKQEGFGEILFPVEPGITHVNALRRCVALAQELGSSIALFHSISNPLVGLMQSSVYLFSGGIVPNMPSPTDRPVARQQRQIELWAQWCRNEGVPTTALTDFQGSSATDGILSLARQRGSSLILMETHAGAVSAALIGSVTRMVARHAPCPVWTFHPETPWVSRIQKRSRKVPRAA